MQPGIKVVHLIGQLLRGGAERQLLALAKGLQHRGWNQAVVTFNSGDVWEDSVIGMGMPLVRIPRRTNRLLRLWELNRVVEQLRPDLLHSWSHHTSVYLRWTPCSGRPKRIVSFRSNPAVSKYTGAPLRRFPNPKTYSAADCVISNSRAALEVAWAAGVRMRRFEVVDNIVTAGGGATPGEPTPAPHIVAAGALIPLKAYDVLLQALAMLASRGFGFKLSIAGDGSEAKNLEAQAAELGIRECVEFLGSIDDITALLVTGHLLVHPSRSEGLSNTILEAMAEGLPVIAANVGGNPELVLEGKTGLLVPPGCPVRLAERMEVLLTNHCLREEMGKAGLELVRNRCDPDRVLSMYERIYRSVAIG